jgi:DNA-binding response OmpR family regulator
VSASQRVVLVVDDDPAVRAVVRTVLEADGYHVVDAADGEAALILVDSIMGRGPDLVVLDVMMPGIDGIEVCRQLAGRPFPIVMLSARDDVETQKAALEAGAVEYLTKPFSAVELLDVARTATVR